MAREQDPGQWEVMSPTVGTRDREGQVKWQQYTGEEGITGLGSDPLSQTPCNTGLRSQSGLGSSSDGRLPSKTSMVRDQTEQRPRSFPALGWVWVTHS